MDFRREVTATGLASNVGQLTNYRPEETCIARESIAEVTAISEEGLIDGLPLVMNHAATYDFVIDRNSGQWKAPFNEISNERHVFTYKDTIHGTWVAVGASKTGTENQKNCSVWEAVPIFNTLLSKLASSCVS